MKKLGEYACTIAGAVSTDGAIYNQGSGTACLREETHRQATKDPRYLGNVEPQNKEY